MQSLRSRVRTIVPFLGAAPALAALLLSLAVLLVVAIGGRTYWLDSSLTMSEAALLGDISRVERLLNSGQAIDVAYPIRSEYRSGKHRLSAKETMLTPVQAAVIGNRVIVLIRLFQRSVAPAPEEVNSLWCLARERRSGDIDAWFKQRAGTDASSPHCT